ncbi:hypothetical protein ACFL6S_33860 [Candidatus Poribacteria bacterium]
MDDVEKCLPKVAESVIVADKSSGQRKRYEWYQNWKFFKEHREIIGKPLRQEEIEEAEKMLRCTNIL